MPKTNKQQLEHEIMQAVQKYRICQHTSVEKGAQLGMEILGKYAPIPESLKRFAQVPKERPYIIRLPEFLKRCF